jgi:hypothetical protein
MRCCLSSRSTVDLRSRPALAGVDAMAQPRRREVVGQLLHLRVIPPELMMDTVTQPNPFRPEFLCKARPRTQFDEPWISNLKAAEQTPVRA